MNQGQGLPNFEKIVKHSQGIFGCIDLEGNIQYVSGACRSMLGYESEEITGRRYIDFLHPDDSVSTSQAIQETINSGKKKSFENRYFHRNGHTVTIQWSCVWSESEEMLYCIGRDVTEQNNNQLRLKESEQDYRALFDNSPDILFVEDRNGLITKVNKRFRAAFDVTDEQVVGRPVSCIFSPEMASVNEQSLQQALLGKSLRFDLELMQEGEKKIFDTEKHPVIIDSEIVRVQTIAKDITPIVRSYELIEKQANKLNNIFESITDAFFALDREWKFTYVNSVFAKLEGYEREGIVGKVIWELFPQTVSSLFHKKCTETAASGVANHFEENFSNSGSTYSFSVYPSEEGVSVYFIDVTEQRKTKQELEKLSLVASETTNGAVIMDSEYRIEWVNEAFTKLTGYTLKEAVGRKPIEFLAHDHSDLNVLASATKQLLTGESVSYEVLNRTKSGEDLWLSINSTPVYDENGKLVKIIAIQSDSTEKVKYRRELQKLSLVASKTNNSVIIADKDWRIEWVNEGLTRLMGYSTQEAFGKRPSELFHSHKTDRTTFEALEEKLLQGIPISFEELNIKENGEDVWVSVDITAVLDGNGKIERFIEVHTDITALKEKELELTKLSQDLYKQNRDLQQFTYIVSHNLRAPVANAIGLTNLLTIVDKSTETFEKSLVNLKESVARLDMVIKDMNTILSIRDSKITLEQEQVNVRDVVQQVLSSFQSQLQECGGIVSNTLEDSLTVRANRAYVYSIFYNLMSNAIKYRSKERSLKIYINSCIGKGIKISFTDNGSGFDMKKAGDNLFKLYKRFHTNKKGRGIGLYLVKTHLEAMDGHVEVISTEGQGTSFLIGLPEAQNEDIYH